jgi:zinc and cadmium transporter
MILLYTLASTIGISLLSLVGVFTLSMRRKSLQKILMLLVSLSAGTLMGTVFLHLLPEAHHELGADKVYLGVLLSFITFFLLEKVLHWQHCHHTDHMHSFGYLNLIGDSLHNFIDGLVIAGAYAADINLGLVTTLAVALHELPQEIGDFGVLVHAGMSNRRALIYNALSALAAVVGALVGLLLLDQKLDISAYLLPFAAGGFLYIAASDLLPEIRKEANSPRLFLNFGVFLVGIALVALFQVETH